MKPEAEKQLTEEELNRAEEQARTATAGLNAAASAAIVNRTHRVIRARAQKLQTQRSKVRSLWIPLGVSAALLVTLVCAGWTAFEDFEGTQLGLPGMNEMLVLVMWSVPISVMILAVIGFRRANAGSENERVR